MTTLTAHACGRHVVRVERGQLIASLFVVAIMNAGRPELADLSPGIDQLGWRIAEWRSTSTWTVSG